MQKTTTKPKLDIWKERYGHMCPIEQGKVIQIVGAGRKDTYNPTLYDWNGTRILAFRYENRLSNSQTPVTYHPAIAFAQQGDDGRWHLNKKLGYFDMMEDPFLFFAEEQGLQRLIFGGVWVRNQHGSIIPRTEFYRGDSLETLERIPFATIDSMKDVRLLQLPDNRFLLCRRPRGDKYMRGRITLHVIDSLDDLVEVDKMDLPVLAILDSCEDALDWVGLNNLYMLKDSEGRAWVGLLGHVALEDHDGTLHYAVCTYRIALTDLLSKQAHKVCPHIIATRGCFEKGPAKNKNLKDVVFPGHLEHVDGYHYRLWAGLSDTRIGCLEIDDPFGLQQKS